MLTAPRATRPEFLLPFGNSIYIDSARSVLCIWRRGIELVRRCGGTTTILLFGNRPVEDADELRGSSEISDLTGEGVLHLPSQVLCCAAVLVACDPHPQHKQMRRSMRILLWLLTTGDGFLHDTPRGPLALNLFTLSM